jgi:chromate reductase
MSAEFRIAVLIGSLRRESFNKRLAAAVAKLSPPELEFQTLRIDDLPLYNQDDDDHRPEPPLRLKREIEASDGLLFATPEYNRSVPGVLKNAIDHGSRPYGKNSFAGKPAGLIGASVGSIGTALAQQHLRGMLGYLDAPTLGQPECFIQFTEGLIDQEGNVRNESTRKFLHGWAERYAAWVKRFAARR